MKPHKLFLTLAAVSLFVTTAASVSVSAQEVSLGGARAKIAVASNVRVRTGPQVAAQEVARLKLGSLVSAGARTAAEEEIAGKRDYWYRVTLPSGESGWAFGGFLADYDAARREDVARRIIDERLKAEQLKFDEGVDLYNFVSDVLAGAKGAEARGEFELLKLLALGRAVQTIQPDDRERPPYSDFLKPREQQLYFHDLAGSIAVRSEIFWELERKHRATPVGERIAWEAAQNLTPGECESDEVCQFLRLYETEGKYLSLYPNGAHAGEVLKNFDAALASEDLKNTLNGKGGDKYTVEARAELRKALAGLRATLAKVSAPEKAAVTRRLGSLAPAAR